MDYCNSLLYGLPSSDINKLQRIQNIPARLVTGAKRRDSISAILEQLHWQPIRERIVFKILLITFKAMHNMAPGHISDLLMKYIPPRNLRSANKSLLQIPVKVNTHTYGQRSFSYAAPHLWNSLPEEIKNLNTIDSFKSALKTFLFIKHFKDT